MTKTVFLLEDDKDTSSLMSAILENYGFKPKVAYSIKEGETILQNHSDFDLFFLDYNLPDGESLELIDKQLIKEKSKIILCSAHLSQEKRKRAHEMGINYCLKKPINFELLDKTLTSLNEKNTDHR